MYMNNNGYSIYDMDDLKHQLDIIRMSLLGVGLALYEQRASNNEVIGAIFEVHSMAVNSIIKQLKNIK